MNNISFANPYLLLLIIPLLLLCLVPFFIAVKKDRLNKRNVLSLIIHLVVCFLITLVISGFTYELVITETNVYVMADVSYSSHENLDKIDNYIDRLEDNVPKNTKIGVVAFAKDYELLNKPGEKIKSVKENSVDDSATNISEALKYTGSLFKNNVIKRIVIISDGKETNRSNIVSIVDQLKSDDIYIDAIYLDNNIKPEQREVQISSLDFNPSTFKNKDESIRVLVDSSYETRGVLNVSLNGEVVKSQAAKLDKGLNVVNIPLDTSMDGSFDYKVSLEGFSDDTNSYNNSYLFSQRVSSEANILFIGAAKDDYDAYMELYNEENTDGISFNVEAYYKKFTHIPYTIEKLCKFDEIVLSNVDVRKLPHSKEFLTNLDMVVSEFGKKLVTFGNTYIQNDKDEVLDIYSRILPTNYGNDTNEAKVLALVLDISKSLAYEERIDIAKAAAKATVDILSDKDMIMVVGFYGNVEILQSLTSMSDREKIKKMIDDIDLRQGTSLGVGLEAAYNGIKDLPYKEKQIMLISDGLPYGKDKETAYKVAEEIKKKNIVLNTLNTNQPRGTELLKDLSTIASGHSYVANGVEDASSIVLGKVSDDLTETVINNGFYDVKIKNPNSPLVSEIESLPKIEGYYFNTPKNHTNVVLEAEYVSRGGVSYDVPIYTTWEYGVGEVASFTSDIASFWTTNLKSSSEGRSLFNNIRESLIPDKKIDIPFRMDVEFDGTNANIGVFAPSVTTNDRIEVQITRPNGEVETKLLAFDSIKFATSLEISSNGKYQIDLTYTNGNLKYESQVDFNISYSPEYDSFTRYEASSLYHMVSENGQVSEDGNLKLKNDSSYVESYLYDFTILFVSICAALFIVDLFVRKIKLDDIKSFFKLRKEKK